jgi:hypothetical protein
MSPSPVGVRLIDTILQTVDASQDAVTTDMFIDDNDQVEAKEGVGTLRRLIRGASRKEKEFVTKASIGTPLVCS